MAGYRVRRDRILFVDLELTCWANGSSPEGQSPEIIEVGVAEVDVESLSVLRAGSLLVKPVMSEVSDFCESLTGLSTRRLMREGRPLEEAFGALRKKWGSGGKAWMAWGSDRQAVERDCAMKGLDSPFSQSFHDIGLQFSLLMGGGGAIGLSEAMRLLGVDRTGREHSGVDDAVSAAEAWIAASRAVRGVLAPRPDGLPSP